MFRHIDSGTSTPFVPASDPAYQRAVSGYNLAAHVRPDGALLARSTDDVVAAVRTARRAGALLRVSATGHAAAAGAPFEGSLLVRTALATPILIDPAARIARIPAGTTGFDAVRDLHARHFVEYASRRAAEERGPRQAEWLAAMRQERGNLLASLEWLLLRDDLESAVRLGWDLWMFWWFDGYLVEGARWFDRMVAAGDRLPPLLRAHALAAAGLLKNASGDPAGGRERLERSLPLYRSVGDRPGVAVVTGALGHIVLAAGDDAAAAPLIEESLRIYRELGDDWYEALMMNLQSGIPLRRGDTAAAEPVLRRALGTARRLDDALTILLSLYNLASVERLRADRGGVERHLAEGLQVAARVGDRSTMAGYLTAEAEAARDAGEPDRAATLHGAAEAMVSSSASSWLEAYAALPVDRANSIARTRDSMAPDRFAVAWAEGRSWDPDTAVRFAATPGTTAAGGPDRPPTSAPGSRLSWVPAPPGTGRG